MRYFVMPACHLPAVFLGITLNLLTDAAFGEKILDVSEAQAETMVNPDGTSDDCRRETMTVAARPAVLNATSVSGRYPT